MSVIGKHDGILVAGGGGFIGGHLVAALLADGHDHVRSVDIKPLSEWYQRFDPADNRVLDLRDRIACKDAVDGTDYVFNLAADMGGMGFIEFHKADCMLSVLINTHLLMAARDAKVKRFFFASSACVYAADKQTSADVVALKEEDAYPADAEDGYGWEKLFSERMCRHFTEDFGLETRIARYHNVYGPHGTWDGGREKAPAACCRKVIECRDSNHRDVEIWGDGQQTRSFMYIDDCIEGTRRLMDSDLREPVNIGSDELVTIDRLYCIAEEAGGVHLEHGYDPSKPKGVRGRNSDNTMIRRELGWAPSIKLEDGMRRTFAWIDGEKARAKRRKLSVNLDTFFESEFDEHEAVVRATRAALKREFTRLVEASAMALESGNKIVFFGNGGSASDAQHLAAELVVRYKVNRAPLAALALTTDSSVLTAGANDFGYETVFERQLRALCRKGDVAIGITTSGNSPNVIKALEAAREIGVLPAALSGRGGGKLKGLADPLLVVPSNTIARIQEMHITLGQMLCDALEQRCAAK